MRWSYVVVSRRVTTRAREIFAIQICCPHKRIDIKTQEAKSLQTAARRLVLAAQFSSASANTGRAASDLADPKQFSWISDYLL